MGGLEPHYRCCVFGAGAQTAVLSVSGYLSGSRWIDEVALLTDTDVLSDREANGRGTRTRQL